MKWQWTLTTLAAIGAMQSATLAQIAIPEKPNNKVVLVVMDGLRGDACNAQDMPTLFALSQRGVLFAHHHPVYLSSTEVNGCAIATGGYPRHTNVMANVEYRPAIDAVKPFGMENEKEVRKGDELTNGHYLGLPTIAELVRKNQRGSTVVAGTKAVIFLHDRFARDSADSPLLSQGTTLPENLLQSLVTASGPFPSKTDPKISANRAQDTWTTQSVVKELWAKGVPAFTTLWLSEPDYAQHGSGPGSAVAKLALKSSDDQLATVLAVLKEKKELQNTDVIVVSDHGFSTITGNFDYTEALTKAGLDIVSQFPKPAEAGSIMMVSNSGSVSFYVTNHDDNIITQLVSELQKLDGTGVIFTREEKSGTFALKDANIDTVDAPDVVVSMKWFDEAAPETGLKGTLICEGAKRKGGKKGAHTSLSKYDMHNTLIAAGPHFKIGFVDQLPSGNIDVAPTILSLLKVPADSERKPDGRVLHEALVGDKEVAQSVAKKQLLKREGIWSQYLDISRVGNSVYLDEGNGGVVKGK